MIMTTLITSNYHDDKTSYKVMKGLRLNSISFKDLEIVTWQNYGKKLKKWVSLQPTYKWHYSSWRHTAVGNALLALRPREAIIVESTEHPWYYGIILEIIL